MEFLTEKKIPPRNVPGVLKRKKKNKKTKIGGRGRKKISLQNFLFKNVPGVLKRMHKKKILGGGDFGVFGAPHAPTRGSCGVGKRYTSSYDHDM